MLDFATNKKLPTSFCVSKEMVELSWQHDFYLTILTSVVQCREAEINMRETDDNGDDYNDLDHNLTALTIDLKFIPDERVHNSDSDPVKCAKVERIEAQGIKVHCPCFILVKGMTSKDPKMLCYFR